MATAMAVSPEVPKSLSNLFAPPTGTDVCVRCTQRVYLVEKVGPINEVVFHKQCFKCSQCSQHLTLKTYFTNRENVTDKEVYCSAHCPKYSSHGLDAQAVGIKQAMRSQAAGKGYNNPATSSGASFGPDAMFIAHPVDAQKNYQKKGQAGVSAHHFPAYLSRVQDKIYKAQEELERRQREDEDRLMSALMQGREKERENVQREVEQEWERNLKDLTERYETDMTKKNKKDIKALTVRYESEKNKMKTDMTSKMQQKREAMTVRLRSEEQEQTSSMVQKHSKEMLELLKQEQEKIKEELKNEMASDDAIEDLAIIDDAMAALALPTELPSPHAPRCRKRDLYYDPVVFKELDEDVFRVAESDQATFTDLVRDLTENCLSDLQKARAIFRWITVKDLNVIEFDDAGDTDTPMGLLRGIKFGTETYHTLFMRLCSYAGLACVEIKGHSKSVGYEPGMKIREDTFQNTWNAVLIDGDWWPVQCNWGARHLVLHKDPQTAQAQKSSKKHDKIRYQYDEHYFLTDPDEFIQEFWAQDPKWQLLDATFTLDEFEAMPFVRSVFFQYGLEFDKPMKAVLHTDNKGGTEVKVRVPVEFVQDLVFHYQIRFADRERRHETEFKGAKLERFVFHSLHDGAALFSVHVPAPAAYFLEIFANKIDDSSKIGDDPNATMMPFRLKCACKYKIVCEELVGKMHPLPNCASGEWGPSKGSRHFGLKPLTHTTGVVNVDNDTEIRFKLPRPLHFLCKLRMNGVEDHQMEKYVKHTVLDNMLTVMVRPPNTGQYGLDIYARPEGAIDNHTLAHACKYLLNVTRVNDPVEMSRSPPPPSPTEPSSPKMAKDKWGPSQPAFDDLKLRTITHSEPIIDTSSAELVIELGLGEQLKMSFQFLREPNEDAREKVTFKDKGDRVKFLIRLGRPGNYLLAVYARKKKDSDSNMYNVYNYMIRYSPDDSSLNRKKDKQQKSLFRR